MRSVPKTVYMIRNGVGWVRDPALAAAGFQYLTFPTNRAAQAWVLQHGNPRHRVERVWVRVGGV